MDAGQHAEKKGRRRLRGFISFFVMVGLAALFSFLISTFVIQGYLIPSGSMENTLMTGDRVFAEKISYYKGDIKQGDIVTFQDPEIPGRILIKRCVAVAGQTVDLRNGALYVNGEKLSEPYTLGKPSDPLRPTITYPYTVPSDTIWVMGDNRTNSQDSRYFGPIKTSTVSGRAICIYWPIDHMSVLH